MCYFGNPFKQDKKATLKKNCPLIAIFIRFTDMNMKKLLATTYIKNLYDKQLDRKWNRNLIKNLFY